MVSFPFLLGVLVGPLVGLLATLAMDPVMARLPEGETAPKVAAGVLTATPIDDAPERLATWVHYVAGGGSGLLFVGLAAGIGRLGAGPAATVAATAVVMLGLMIGFFVFVPLPRAEGVARGRLRQIRRDWAVSAGAYVLVAALLVGIASAVVAGGGA